MRSFIRPGYTTFYSESDSLSVGHAEAMAAWKIEGEQRAAAMEITASEYATLARRGLLAQHIEANAAAYAARPDTQSTSGRACAASLFRQAAAAVRAV